MLLWTHLICKLSRIVLWLEKDQSSTIPLLLTDLLVQDKIFYRTGLQGAAVINREWFPGGGGAGVRFRPLHNHQFFSNFQFQPKTIFLQTLSFHQRLDRDHAATATAASTTSLAASMTSLASIRRFSLLFFRQNRVHQSSVSLDSWSQWIEVNVFAKHDQDFMAVETTFSSFIFQKPSMVYIV